MKLVYVKPVNLDLLENAYKSGILEAKDFTKDFGKNLTNILSHIKISFLVSEISILEAYLLRQFCCGEMIDIGTYMDDNKINSDKYPNTHRAIQSLFLLNRTIQNDNDVEINLGSLLFPIKCVEKECLITFRSNSILNLTGIMSRSSDCFFNRVYEIQKKDQGGRSKNDIINDLLIEAFFKEFYTYASNKLQYTDFLSDSVLDFAYLQHAKNNNNLISLSHINTLYGELQFINSTPDLYKYLMDTINKNKESLKLSDNNVNMKGSDIYFVCNTSLYTFLELALYLPLDCIIESTDLKIVYNSSQYIIPKETEKYRSRITSILEKLHKERIGNQAGSNIDNYNLIPLNTKIQYSLKFNLSEVSDIIMGLEKKINTNNIYGENTYLSREILKMISDLKQMILAIYKAII